MSGFRAFLRAERIKWRKDWTLLTTLLVPFTQVGFLFLIAWFSEQRLTQLGPGFVAWYEINYIVWNLVFMPIATALVTTLSWDLEEKSRAWDHLFVQPVSPSMHYWVKLASHLSLMVLAQLLLAVLLVLGGWLLRIYVPTLMMGAVPAGLMVRLAGFSMLASLAVMGLHTWLPTRFPGLGTCLGVALGGTWLTFHMVGGGAAVCIAPWGLACEITNITLRGKAPSLGMYAGSFACAIGLVALGHLDFKWRATDWR